MHALVDLQALGLEGGAGVVTQLRAIEGQLTPDPGAEQTDRSTPAVRRNVRAIATDYGGSNSVCVEGWLAWVFKSATREYEYREASVADVYSFVEQAVDQFERDCTCDVLQVDAAV